MLNRKCRCILMWYAIVGSVENLHAKFVEGCSCLVLDPYHAVRT